MMGPSCSRFSDEEDWSRRWICCSCCSTLSWVNCGRLRGGITVPEACVREELPCKLVVRRVRVTIKVLCCHCRSRVASRVGLSARSEHYFQLSIQDMAAESSKRSKL